MSAATLRAGRRPKHDRPGGISVRDAIWAAIRQRRHITTREAADVALCHPSSAAIYLRSLAQAGIVEEVQGDGVAYHLTVDAGPVTPRVRRDGTSIRAASGRARMWVAMRIQRRFTVRTIAVYADASEVDAKSYCGMLRRAGYLRVVTPGKGLGYAGILTEYALIRDTGPRPPQVTNIKCVWDANLGEIVWPVKGEDLA